MGVIYDSPPSYLAITFPPLFKERGLGGEFGKHFLTLKNVLL